MTGKILSMVFCMCFLAQVSAYSQVSDTLPKLKRVDTQVSTDGVVKDSARLAIEAMPGIAARRSAILPGLGQIYNKRWWKVPLVYGGFVGIGLVYEFNQRQYKKFLTEAQYRQDEPGKANPAWKAYTDEGIIGVKDDYRRTRDLSILGGIAFYAIQVIDAYIDAKFYRFDVSDDLSLNIDPFLQPTPGFKAFAPVPKATVGFKVRLSL